MDDRLSAEAELRIAAFAEEAAQVAREAYLAGARLGNDAFADKDAGAALPRWRRGTLARYTQGTWKHSIVELVPAPLFRPSQIYTDRRAELESRHPGHNNLGVGTHNTLAELIRDKVIVKIDDGLYAPAIDGNAIPATPTYRPRSPVDESYALQIGYAHWTWSTVEWEIVHLAGTLDDSFLSQHARSDSPAIAAAFRTVAGAQRSQAVAGDVNALADAFDAILERRKTLLLARPCTRTDGHPGYTYSGRLGQVDWSEAELASFSEACEITGRDANALRRRIRDARTNAA